MDVKQLIQYVIDHKKAIYVLESLGCHSIRERANEYRCALPNDDDNTKVTVFYKDLSIRVYTKGESIFGNLYELIGYIKGLKFPETYHWLATLLDISRYTIADKNQESWKDLFNQYMSSKKRSEVTKFCERDLSILNQFIHLPTDELIKEGIFTKRIMEKYKVCYDPDSQRIVFPHFHHETGKVIGLVGRTTIVAHKELKIPKYFPVQDMRYEKSKSLYGLYQNREEILRQKKVIIFESEKSVIKADMYGYPIGVSVGCHDISKAQIQLLINLGVEEVTISFDKDVEIDHIIKLKSMMDKHFHVNFTYDLFDELGEKDSIVDKGYRKFRKLVKRKYTKKEQLRKIIEKEVWL